MKTPEIKVCGMRNSENVKALVELKPDYIGFIFYAKSKRFAEGELDKDIINNLPDSIKKVGVFVNESIDKIHTICQEYNLTFVQLHGDESVEDCIKMKSLNYKVIKAFGIDEDFNFDSLSVYEPYVDYFLFDTKTKDYGGSGQVYDWEVLKQYKGQKPYFLSGGIGEDNIDNAFEFQDERMQVLDLNSKFEIEAGLKNIDLLRTKVFVRR